MIGYKMVHEENIYWKYSLGTIVPMLPPTENSGIRWQVARRILKKYGVMLIRWESVAVENSATEWWHVVKKNNDKPLSSKLKNQVKKGRRNFYCDIVSREYIAENGYAVYQQSHSRYQTFERLFTKEEFCQAVLELPSCTEFYVVRDILTQELVGYSENYLRETVCFFNSMWFITSALNKYCAYVLIAEMIDDYLLKRKFTYLSNGARNISHNTNIHQFLINKFGFEKVYYNLNVEYVVWLKLIIIIIYPFRSLIPCFKISFIQKVKAILYQEEISRSFKF